MRSLAFRPIGVLCVDRYTADDVAGSVHHHALVGLVAVDSDQGARKAQFSHGRLVAMEVPSFVPALILLDKFVVVARKTCVERLSIGISEERPD